MEPPGQGETVANRLYGNTKGKPRMGDGHYIDKPRWADLMYSLQNIATLQKAATRARIDVRQKGREASFRRQDVWTRDARFMKEIQRLNAQGLLRDFDELSRLAEECQATRDLLGPLEQDIIELESRWQGQMWKLREAEEDLYVEFEDEFGDAAGYVEAHGSEGPPSIVEENAGDPTFPIIKLEAGEAEDQLQLDLAHANAQDFEKDASGSDLDSGVGDLESDLKMLPLNEYGPPQALPKSYGIEIYHTLLEDFSTRRERVNKWLENIILESHLEGVSLQSILQDLLATVDQKLPSNWSQLVIAYWELDEASVPKSHEKGESNLKQNVAIEHLNSVKVENKDQRDTSIPAVETEILSAQLSTTHINPPETEGNLSTSIPFGMRLAIPTQNLPSPPVSHSNSRPSSRDALEEQEPP